MNSHEHIHQLVLTVMKNGHSGFISIPTDSSTSANFFKANLRHIISSTNISLKLLVNFYKSYL